MKSKQKGEERSNKMIKTGLSGEEKKIVTKRRLYGRNDRNKDSE
jgi:hypothetical protein